MADSESMCIPKVSHVTYNKCLAWEGKVFHAIHL